ncbi:SWIM zinc finger domain-containing protein [Rhodococcus sp. IEGM 1318]|uniref:SWIM zinc finger family protein n=1 Tax=Rhodococcus sp. IEGM 1318 TaxID=3082226 RepID=UPI0029539910|nr:SWIM zinc finger family protein [Rhodococcus sp. IEGM 1318]MDV8004766.1 SWIM zinc finger family protein [Rhodococcus sp. IEGM 1318]
MTSPWTAGQVASVAPDAASLAAARKLVGSWSHAGNKGLALWGLCQGSGSKPYQAVVDLRGPAYKCSCPSRKFPCKHALGLLVEWSEGRVPSADEPADFAAEWLLRREEKADTSAETAGDEAPKKTRDPATAQKRADRVASGLVELDLWITDQIRSGLAAMDTSWAGLDAVAARMVDAQAPGIAGTLRALAGTAESNENWPEKVLDELARLRLLVAAHQKLPGLPEDLAHSVKAHVGYPVSADSVMESTPVRENWMVLGFGITEEKRLFTRTVWMLGRNSRRWATLLDFSHGSPNFSTETPLVGYLVDADVHFYPGASALRARLGATHGEPEPFATMPSGSIDAALQQFTDALAADPWLRSWPAVISSVVPSFVDGAWFLVDESGTAIRAEGDSDLLWKLLGISGGYPVTVCGTWNAQALTPISVFTGGQVIVL